MDHIAEMLEYLSTYAVLSESAELVDDMDEIIKKVMIILKLNDPELSKSAYIIILDNIAEFADKNIVSINDNDEAKSVLFNTIKTIKSGMEKLQLGFDMHEVDLPNTDKV